MIWCPWIDGEAFEHQMGAAQMKGIGSQDGFLLFAPVGASKVFLKESCRHDQIPFNMKARSCAS